MRERASEREREREREMLKIRNKIYSDSCAARAFKQNNESKEEWNEWDEKIKDGVEKLSYWEIKYSMMQSTKWIRATT